MNRGVSTVVDVALFLLFVGAAAAALVNASHVESPTTDTPAADRAELLATTTETVEYTVSPREAPAEWIANATARERRTAHGTVAELLAETAVSRAEIGDTRLSNASVGFERAVRNVTARVLADPAWESAVRATWEPYRGGPITGTVRVGDSPPPAVDVHAAVSAVPVSTLNAREQARARDGYGAVGAVVANAVVATLFPRPQSQRSLDGSYPTARITEERYDRVGMLVDESLPPLRSANAANRHLRDGLTAVFREDMRDRFESPDDAAGAVSAGVVRVTIRVWKP
jgi:hypothetical protein